MKSVIRRGMAWVLMICLGLSVMPGVDLLAEESNEENSFIIEENSEESSDKEEEAEDIVVSEDSSETVEDSEIVEEPEEEPEEGPESEDSENESEETIPEESEEPEEDSEEVTPEEEPAKEEKDPEEDMDPNEYERMVLGLDEIDALALNAVRYTYDEEIVKFPDSYQTKLKALHEKYPKWVFVAVDTGLTWKEAVTAEGSDNRSLVPYETTTSRMLMSKEPGDYNPNTGAYTMRDSNKWVNATKETVAYFMDPRNFLDEDHILMFESMSYQKTQTLSNINAVLDGTFMNKDNGIYYYLKSKGKYIYSTNYDTYAECMEAAGIKYNISPVFLASKIRQEVGVSGTGPATSGKAGTCCSSHNYGNMTGYYNFYNIHANDSVHAAYLGLYWASGAGASSYDKSEYNLPWTTPVLSIFGGAKYIASNYIGKGQDTSYYMRFNVAPNNYYPHYSHQYMTNIAGVASESYTTCKSAKDMGTLSQARVFYIPVYSGMPGPTGVKVDKAVTTAKTTTSVTMRNSASILGGSLVTVPSGAEVTVLSGKIWDTNYSYSFFQYPYWFRVKYTYGNSTYTGYICSKYLKLDSERSLSVGETSKLAVTKGALSHTYYETSDPSVATVNKSGVITGVGSGRCEIYAINDNGTIDGIGVTVGAAAVVGDTVKITFDKQDGSTPESVSYVLDRAIGTLPNPKRTGYAFQGWYTAAEGGTKINSTTKVTKKRTYYAQWKKLISADFITVNSISDKTFKGVAVKPVPVLKDNGVRLYKNQDFTVTYKNNALPGTATITVTGIGEYAGTRKVTFKINPKILNYKTTGKVNYRVGAGLIYQVAGTKRSGALIEVVRYGSKVADGYRWYLIRIGTKYYYMARNYLKKVATTTTTTTTPATTEKLITYKTTANLNYRSTPSVSGTLKGTLTKGTSVSVVSGYSKSADGYTWYKIKIGSSYYYAVASYLTK